MVGAIQNQNNLYCATPWMGQSALNQYLTDLQNPALHDQALGQLSQEMNDSLGGMDPAKLRDALSQMQQMAPADLMKLLALLDPELQQSIAQALGARTPQIPSGQPRGWSRPSCPPGGGIRPTPLNASKRTPTDATRRTPTDATRRTPTDATRRTPTDATRTPTDGNRTTPVNTTDGTNVPRMARYAPGSQEARNLFREAIRLNNQRNPNHPIPESWADSQGLHNILSRESDGQVGRPNYTYGARARDPSQWASVQEELRNGVRTTRSSATGLGQLLLSNVDRYYPDGRRGIGDPVQEAAGMLRYIQDRYGNPENAWRLYGRGHEGY
ncbi:MAG: hypothetical protein U1E65_22475 [Myxococcota bacterium]